MSFLSNYIEATTLAVLTGLVGAAVLVGFVLISAVFFIWLERKVAGRIQDRLGPTRVGGKFGWLQTIADGIKLICKEDFIPDVADHFLFRLAVYLTFVGPFVAFMVLPFGWGVVALEMNAAVYFMLGVLSSEVFGIILAGYGSGSKWSLFGGMREAAQMVSYEVPRTILALIPVMIAGTMNLNVIGQQQAGFFWNWYMFHDPFLFIAFWVFFVAVLASCKRAPFDLAEAESELVGGFHTEYSGFRWSLFFMAEYGSMFVVSGLAIVLYAGAWHTGVLPADVVTYMTPMLGDFLGTVVGNAINITVFIIKTWILVFVMIWVRWTLPRLRIDQVMMTCLKYLLPISCFCFIGGMLTPLVWNTFIGPATGIQWRNPPAQPAGPAPSPGYVPKPKVGTVPEVAQVQPSQP